MQKGEYNIKMKIIEQRTQRDNYEGKKEKLYEEEKEEKGEEEEEEGNKRENKNNKYEIINI